MSDTTRLSRATAERYTLSPLVARELRRANKWNCYGVFAPMVRQSAGRIR
jgi:hypothetical protein